MIFSKKAQDDIREVALQVLMDEGLLPKSTVHGLEGTRGLDLAAQITALRGEVELLGTRVCDLEDSADEINKKCLENQAVAIAVGEVKRKKGQESAPHLEAELAKRESEFPTASQCPSCGQDPLFSSYGKTCRYHCPSGCVCGVQRPEWRGALTSWEEQVKAWMEREEKTSSPPSPEKPLHVRVAEALGTIQCELRDRVWVGVAAHLGETTHWPLARYDIDWSATGPLVEKYRLSLNCISLVGEGPLWKCYHRYADGRIQASGSTSLEAICHWIIEAGKRRVW